MSVNHCLLCGRFGVRCWVAEVKMERGMHFDASLHVHQRISLADSKRDATGAPKRQIFFFLTERSYKTRESCLLGECDEMVNKTANLFRFHPRESVRTLRTLSFLNGNAARSGRRALHRLFHLWKSQNVYTLLGEKVNKRGQRKKE